MTFLLWSSFGVAKLGVLSGPESGAMSTALMVCSGVVGGVVILPLLLC